MILLNKKPKSSSSVPLFAFSFKNDEVEDDLSEISDDEQEDETVES